MRRYAFVGMGILVVKLLAEYLEHVVEFQALAARENNPTLKARYAERADTYRQLATKRAADIGLNLPALMQSREG
jgi:hypothetical protein